MKYADVTI